MGWQVVNIETSDNLEDISRGLVVVKLSSGMPIPVYAIPTPVVQPQIVGYPLIPAPLGPVPSPIIMPPNRKAMRVQKRYKSRSKSKSRSREPTPRRSRSKSSTKEPQITQEDLVQTYT
ncbi:hypothetical protein GWI33_010908, partial [Rhynchophorus ferrugineus]